MSRHFLDLRRLLCPVPVMRVQSYVEKLDPEDVLEVVATDPGVLYDIPAWCRIHGYDILSSVEEKNEIRFEIAIPKPKCDTVSI